MSPAAHDVHADVLTPHEAQGVEHAMHVLLPSPLSISPEGHWLRQAPPDKTRPAGHEVQTVALSAAHVSQPPEQAVQMRRPEPSLLTPVVVWAGHVE